jgi:hypothetical protein
MTARHLLRKKADNFMTSGDAILRSEVIKYLRPEILVLKNSAEE